MALRSHFDATYVQLLKILVHFTFLYTDGENSEFWFRVLVCFRLFEARVGFCSGSLCTGFGFSFYVDLLHQNKTKPHVLRADLTMKL